MGDEINDGTLDIIQEFKSEKEDIPDIFDGVSEEASNGVDEADEKPVIKVEFGSKDTSWKDCSGPSICTDGEIICELSNHNVKVKQEVELLEDSGSEVQCKVEPVDQDSCSVVKDSNAVDETEERDGEEGGGGKSSSMLEDMDQIMSNDLEPNQDDPEDLPLPLIDCPYDVLPAPSEEPIKQDLSSSSPLVNSASKPSSIAPSAYSDPTLPPSSCSVNVATDSLAINDEPSESESDEPCPGSGGLYQDEDWISWRHNNSSGENSEVDETESTDDKVLSRKRKLCDNNEDAELEEEEPSCKKSTFQQAATDEATNPPEHSNKTESTRLPEVSSSCSHVKKTSPIPSKDNPPAEMVHWLQQFQGWSNAERILAIGQLIESCEPTQIRHMMQLIEPQFQRDFISLLPRELALYVLTFLQAEDLLRAAQTCRSWRFLAEDNLLWREKCLEAGIDTELPPAVNSSKKSRHKYSYSTSSPWKALFMSHRSVEMNWRTRPIKDPKVLKGHDDHVITCLQFSGSRIVSGSDDNTLKVWSATTGKCLRTLIGHTGGVWSSQMSGSIIVSGSTDRTLKVWNADTGHCLHTLYGHTSTVRCMHLHGKKVVSGSRDATLRVWHIESGECLHVLTGHLAAVRCVQYDGKLVVSGAYDYMVKIWNPDTEQCLHTLSGHTNRVYSLQFDGVHVVSGSLDTSIRVWEAESGSLRHTLMGHQSLTSGMELRNNILVSGNADSTVKVWDIVSGQCLQTLSGRNKHQSAVTCLQFNSRFVVTSSDDGTVKLWDVKTGDFIRNLVSLDSGGSGGVVWRIRASETKLVCAVGSRNGTEETKLLVLDFDVDSK
uniref:F-box/WD repeat-containing protein 7 n=1 Tax=Cacopsylla melanoneura TaxID=428564 RepID=A0A8D8PZE4_9HEMI